MASRRVKKLIISMFVVLSLVVSLGVGGIVVIAAVISCGITALSPIDEAKDLIGGATENAKDLFFNVFSSTEQKIRKANAALIVQIGQERNFSKQSIAIAVATSLQESNLENRPYSRNHNDLDSLGLFQQRPSQNWGKASQIMDPSYAINKFYDRLQTIPDRDTRPMIDVAIQIQNPSRSAYQKRWTWDKIAIAIVNDNYSGDGKVGNNCTSTNSVGWRVPLEPGYRITDPFGIRYHPIKHIMQMHNGQDLTVGFGTPIYAAHDGKVEKMEPYGGYGNFIQLDNGDNIQTDYAHLSAFADDLKVGDTVRAGQVIGEVGSTGASTGPHLHFEVKVNGNFVDPVLFLHQHGVELASK